MNTPLTEIRFTGGSLTLSRDVLGEVAYLALGRALTDDAADVVLTGCHKPVPPTANLLIVQGQLASFLGHQKVDVRLYLFEVAALSGQSERHAILLFTDLPNALSPSVLINRFCPGSEADATPKELAALHTLDFDDPYLLFSTLDYSSEAYLTPPFPPSTDKVATQAQREFLVKVKPDLTFGFVFTAKARLQNRVTIPAPHPASGDTESDILDLSTVLEDLNLGRFCTTDFDVHAQLVFSAPGVFLNLLHPLESALSAQSIPLKPSLTQVGIGLPLGLDVPPIPMLELDGTLSFSATPSQVRMTFSPGVSTLSVSFLDLPDFADLAHYFSGESSLKSMLGDALPKWVIDDLGELTILQLHLSIDCQARSIDTLDLTVITEQPLKLFDSITIQPALIARFTDPSTSYRGVDIEVVGKWFLKGSELDTALIFDRSAVNSGDDATTFIANLSIGSGIDFLELVSELFHTDIAGLPSLTLLDVEVTAQRLGIGTQRSEFVSLELEVASGWTLDGVDVDLDNVSLTVGFFKENSKASWTLQEATAQGTLEIGPVFFNLQADYDPSDRSWAFSGGTLPDRTLTLRALLKAIADALDLEIPSAFLAPFMDLTVTGCHLQYRTSSTTSSSWQMSLSSDFKSGKFHTIDLDQLVLHIARNGTETSLSFDATTAGTHQGVDAVTDYLNTQIGVSVALPGCLTAPEICLHGLSGSYTCDTKSYNFVAYMNFGDNAFVHLNIDVMSQVLGGKASQSYELGGTLIFNPDDDDDRFEFKLEDVRAGAANELVACLQADIGKSITLDKLIGAIDSSFSGLDAFHIDVEAALFAHSGKRGDVPAKSLFAVDMGAAVNLSGLKGLPLIGHEMASVSSLDLAFQIVYGTGDYTSEELKAINQTLDQSTIKFPVQHVAAKRAQIATSVRVGGDRTIDFSVPVAPDDSGKLQPSTSDTEGYGDSGQEKSALITAGGDKAPISWFPLNKAFGPMHVDRLGLAFDKSEMDVKGYLDGGISVGPVSFDLIGLDVAVPLSGESKFEPTFGLQGVGISYQNGPVTINGALAKDTYQGQTSFDGFVRVSAEELEISAIGSFAEMKDGKDSLFVYTVLGEPLGGPAFFFVTGLALGFGYNRRLLPPPLSGVRRFPLISQAMAPAPQSHDLQASGVRDDAAEQLSLMQKSLRPAAGEYFVAVGVKFTSFELVDGFLLASVQAGNTFRVDLLGLANATLPPDDTCDPLAEAQLALEAHYIPSEGSIWVQGQLTPNSYILSRHCHLTGGFALACWDSGVHEGEFVLSIGGYALGYNVPAYYPKPPRVGFNWQVSGDLNVKGGGYFALLPHALMAGGALNAVWHSGPVSAWFLLDANFLIEWKPFHYSADIHVDLGAELTIHFFGTHHISVDVGANLAVWGPDFGGHARLTVHVIGIHFHFSVDFGAAPSPPPPLNWQEFETSFLPDKRAHWLSVDVQAGLNRKAKYRLPESTQEVEVWIVNRDALNIAISSVLPVESATFSLDGSRAASLPIKPDKLGIMPMALDAIHTSTLSITVTKVPPIPHASPTERTEHLKAVPRLKKVPSALWGRSLYHPLNGNAGREVLEAVSGFSVVPAIEAHDDPGAITVPRSSLAYETTQQSAFAWVADTGAFKAEISSWSAISEVIEKASSKRQSVLHTLGFKPGDEIFNQPLQREAPVAAQLVP